MLDTGTVERFTPEDKADKHFVMMYSLTLYPRIYRLQNSRATTEQACYHRQVENILAPISHLLADTS